MNDGEEREFGRVKEGSKEGERRNSFNWFTSSVEQHYLECEFTWKES